jgi:putative endonuclease
MWYVYIIECRNRTLYTGITNDLARRFAEHKQGKGSKFTRAFKVKKLAYAEEIQTKEAALSREYQIKRLTRAEKISLIKKKRPSRKKS